jgi:riboflavin biosynthesis pyrimidine reductase
MRARTCTSWAGLPTRAWRATSRLPPTILWRSLARLDLIDEYRVTLVPYLAGEGTRLFEDAGKSQRLDLVSSTAFSSGLQLDYRRHR